LVKNIIKKYDPINYSHIRGTLYTSLLSKPVDDKKQVLDMISKLVDDPEKFKEILKKSKSEN